MITEELAKKLKDYGYPNSEKWFIKQWYCNSDYCHNVTSSKDEAEKPCWCGWWGWKEFTITNPKLNLSELIEACGDNLIAIQREDTYNGNGEWINKPIKWCAVQEWEDYYPPEVEVGGYGSTPEEAVANLWLELNNKHSTLTTKSNII